MGVRRVVGMLAAAAAAALWALGLGAPPATAGTAVVSQCKTASGGDAASDLLTVGPYAGPFTPGGCDSAAGPGAAVASLGAAGSNFNASSTFVAFSAPGTTRFVDASIARSTRGLLIYAPSDGSSNNYESWALGYRLTDSSGNLMERCGAAPSRGAGAGSGCTYRSGQYELAAPRIHVAEATRELKVSFGCFVDKKCAHWYANPGVYGVSADLTVEDGGAPVIQDTSGGLANATGPVTTDNDDVTISATDVDGLGVLGVEALVDGKAAGQAGWSDRKSSCNDLDLGAGYRYSAGQPCDPTPPPMTWTLPEGPDGRHTVELRVIDAAGNRSRALLQTVVIDRRPPVLDEAPTVSGEPVAGQALACSISGVDAQDPSLAYSWIRTKPDGSDAQVVAGATGTSYTLTAADVGSKLLCRVTVGDRGGVASRTSEPTSGPFEGGQTVGDGRATSSPVVDSSPAGALSLGTAAASAAGPSGPGSTQGPASPAPGCPVGTLVTLEGSSRLVAKRASSATSIAGAVRSGTGAPAAGVVVDLVQRVRRSGVTPTTVASGTSGPDGRFTLKAPVGPSRDLQVVTRTCGASGPVVGQTVRGQLKLRAVNPRVRNGQSVRFSGQAVGGYYGKGVGLELQVLVGRKWQDVRAVRTDRAVRELPLAAT